MDSSLRRGKLECLIRELLKRSESRGKESAGLQIYLPMSRNSWVLKGDHSAHQLVRSSIFRKVLKESLGLGFDVGSARPVQPLIVMGHSRLVTNGSAENGTNNQPVSWGGTTVIHNGIVVNSDEIWARHPDAKRRAEVDSEVIAALLELSSQVQWDPIAAMRSTFLQIEGSATVAWTHSHGIFLGAATNTGDLYLARLSESEGFVFASEKYILESALRSVGIFVESSNVEPRRGLLISLHNDSIMTYGLTQGASLVTTGDTPRMIGELNTRNLSFPLKLIPKSPRHTIDESLLRYSKESLIQLRRCTRCVLPETFPFIEFDSRGVCNYCHSYVTKYRDQDLSESRGRFLVSLENYRSRDSQPDVLVPLSGGRDSCFGLHLIKRELGLNPITFTYDWGMVTDVARRNIARMCGELGVQNVLVSADIRRKRKNIRKNLEAWLMKSELGLVPLLMAGDKSFFFVNSRLRAQLDLRLNIWSASPLENTDFKVGLCGVRPHSQKARIDHLTSVQKTQLAWYYGRAFVANPRYLNSSLTDSIAAFVAYYLTPRPDFVSLFDSFEWNEEVVNETLSSEYGYEVPLDAYSSWRIGDGTASFYNYVYVTAKGFSEFDTFRSNQIREGQISRNDALRHVVSENKPRLSGIKWYLDVLQLDFDTVMRRVNELDVLGLHR